jgi:hypothetical protein
MCSKLFLVKTKDVHIVSCLHIFDRSQKIVSPIHVHL